MNISTDIDFNRIKHEKVRKLLIDNRLTTLDDLSKLKSLCFDQTDGKQYYKHFKIFFIPVDINAAWTAYKTVSPQEGRNGSMVSFSLMYSRKRHEIMYSGDNFPGIEAGQIIFYNLNLFGNILQMAVGHEITGVNDQEKTIKICYIQNGASTGTQLIRLKEASDNTTEVTHETWYRSGSFFRDKVLYPGFHTRGISEFHENIRLKTQQA